MIKQCSLYSPTMAVKWTKSQIIRMPGMLVVMKQPGGIQEFPVHKRDPPVQQLAVYLENGQRVYRILGIVRGRKSS